MENLDKQNLNDEQKNVLANFLKAYKKRHLADLAKLLNINIDKIAVVEQHSTSLYNVVGEHYDLLTPYNSEFVSSLKEKYGDYSSNEIVLAWMKPFWRIREDRVEDRVDLCNFLLKYYDIVVLVKEDCFYRAKAKYEEDVCTEIQLLSEPETVYLFDILTACKETKIPGDKIQSLYLMADKSGNTKNDLELDFIDIKILQLPVCFYTKYPVLLFKAVLTGGKKLYIVYNTRLKNVADFSYHKDMHYKMHCFNYQKVYEKFKYPVIEKKSPDFHKNLSKTPNPILEAEESVNQKLNDLQLIATVDKVIMLYNSRAERSIDYILNQKNDEFLNCYMDSEIQERRYDKTKKTVIANISGAYSKSLYRPAVRNMLIEKLAFLIVDNYFPDYGETLYFVIWGLVCYKLHTLFNVARGIDIYEEMENKGVRINKVDWFLLQEDVDKIKVDENNINCEYLSKEIAGVLKSWGLKDVM